MREGNGFTSICLSVCSQGESLCDHCRYLSYTCSNLFTWDPLTPPQVFDYDLVALTTRLVTTNRFSFALKSLTATLKSSVTTCLRLHRTNSFVVVTGTPALKLHSGFQVISLYHMQTLQSNSYKCALQRSILCLILNFVIQFFEVH